MEGNKVRRSRPGVQVHDPLILPSSVCLVTHNPTGLTHYGKIEDYSLDSNGGLSLIVRIPEDFRETLGLKDNLIDPRFEEGLWLISILCQGPVEIC